MLLRACALAAAAGFAVLALQAGISKMAIESESPRFLEPASFLDPANARLIYALGRARGPYIDSAEQCRLYQRASRLNPNDAAVAGSMASACLTAMEIGVARGAIERTLEMDPTTPRHRWLAVTIYCVAGQSDLMLRQLRTLLELDPSYAPSAFRVVAAAGGDEVLRNTQWMPAANQPRLRLMLATHLAGQRDFPSAAALWDQAVQAGKPPALADVRPYLDLLVAGGQAEQAVRVWQQLQALGTVPSDAAQPASAVFNGDFEREPVAAPFDWRLAPHKGVWVYFDASSAWSGRRSLRADFTTEENPECELAAQFVPVRPSRAYRLLAYARSSAITSDSGPRLRVTDPDCPACSPVETETTTGDTAWRPVEARFTTGPGQHFARIALWRHRSRTFPTRITGRFWLDAVSLRPET